MKVTTVGGGPAGLYASLLLKKAHPEWEITVHERNPADETYGWGIVFPNRALTNLEEADPKSHERITDAFYRWDPIDTFVDERGYRCGGHTFASMMRTNLLSILQERCRELGVDLHFEAEVDDPAALAADADLLLGADGLGSQTREAFSDEFGTEITRGSDRFAWFGTEKEFEALTHTFDHNEDGVWRIHAYPGETTTFIVDCDAETWERSGLEDASEAEYLAYLEEVFAGYLDGHEILSKNDRWWTFRTVHNENWYHDNVVLLGDAVRTAHFSIGSGTTLAMGDAIALAAALEDHDPSDDIEAALATYQAERKPFAERILEAAELSRIHYEDCKRYLDLPDRQFTVHHLTRSGRITYDSLARRDPDFMETYAEWFAEQNIGPVAEADEGVAPPSFQPYALQGTTFPNRTVLPATGGVGADGGPDDAYGDALADAVALAPGLVLTDPVSVTAAGDLPAIETPAQADAWAGAVERARAVDDRPRLGLRLTHPTANVAGDDLAAFVGAAERAREADFDALELDFGLDALGAPLSAGGDGRRTLPLEVVAAVRDAWAGPLFARLPAVGDAHDVWDACDAAHALVRRGADLIVATGRISPAPQVPAAPPTVDLAADWIRNEAEVPTMSTRAVTTRDAVDTLVGAGRADLVRFDAADSEAVDPEGPSLEADLL